MSIFGTKFKELREEKGLYQKDIAEDLGVGSTTVTEWEKGNNTPSVEMLCKIADYFKVSPNELLGYEEIKKSNTVREVPDIKKIG